MVSIPKHTDVTVDTIRGFYNAYLSHKYLIDHLVSLNTTKLVRRNWANQVGVLEFYKKLMQLQDVLNDNVEKLAQLVSQNLTVAST